MKRVIVALAVLASAAVFAQTEEAPTEESAPAVEAPPAGDEPAAEAPAPPQRRRKRAPKAAAPKKKVEAPPKAPAPAPDPKLAQETSPVEELAKQAEQQPPKKLPDGATPEQHVEQVARQFFLNLASGDARGMVESCAFPFMIEDRRFADQSELFQEWLKRVRSKRVDLLVLYGIDVLSPEQMEKKYGPPPARLANFPWKAPGTWIAVANLSGRPAVAVLKQVVDNDFRVIAYTD